MRASFRIKSRLSARRISPHRTNRHARLRVSALLFSLSAWITFPFGEALPNLRTYPRFQNPGGRRPLRWTRCCSCSCRCCSHWQNSTRTRGPAATSSHDQRLPSPSSAFCSIRPIFRIMAARLSNSLVTSPSRFRFLPSCGFLDLMSRLSAWRTPL